MTILIVGLRYGQQHHVARKCPGVADLKFVDANTAEIAYPDADAVIRDSFSTAGPRLPINRFLVSGSTCILAA
jgi:hypothetical protein